MLRAVTANEIIEAVATGSGVEAARLTDGQRTCCELTVARNLVLYISQSRGRITLPAIARTFGFGYCTSVSSAIAQIKQQLARDRGAPAQLHSITAHLDSN